MDEYEEYERKERLRLADAEIDKLRRSVASMAGDHQLGDPFADIPNDSVDLNLTDFAAGKLTEEHIQKAALGFLQLAVLSLAAAQVEINEKQDAAGAITHVIRAARLYGTMRGIMEPWRYGLRHMANNMRSLQDELDESKAFALKFAKGRTGRPGQPRQLVRQYGRRTDNAQTFVNRLRNEHPGLVFSIENTRLTLRDKAGARGQTITLKTIANLLGEMRKELPDSR